MQLGWASVSKMQVRTWLGRHLLFWLCYVCFFTFIMMPRVGSLLVSLETSLLHLPYNILLVYWMIYGIIPKLLDGKYRQFLMLLAIVFLVSLFLHFLFRAFVLIPFRTGKPTPIFNGAINTSYLLIFTIGGFINTQSIIWAAASIKLVRYWYRKERDRQQLVRETLTVELQMLKAQIHPHFLFNTLNNLYSLTLRQSAKAPDTVLKLAGLLHYMLHECNGPTVPLTQEIDFLTNYIDLERLRYGDRLVVTTSVQGDIRDQAIAPLLLIPFLENAFKHGSSQQTGEARIGFWLRVQDQVLTFRLENSTDLVARQITAGMPDEVGYKMGIGLANVRKRLQLIYPDAHTLMARFDHRSFKVDLTINFTGAAASSTTANKLFSHLAN